MGTTNNYGALITLFMANDSTAILDLNGHDLGIDTLSGGGYYGGNITDNSGSGTTVLTVGQSTGTYGYSGKIQNGTSGKILSLSKAFSGTLIISGANTYTGGTTLSSGAIQLGNTSALGTDGLTVNGGTLDLNGNSIQVSSLSGTGGVITDNNTKPGRPFLPSTPLLLKPTMASFRTDSIKSLR